MGKSPQGVLSNECAPGAAGQPQGRAQTDDMTRRVCTVKEVSFLQQIYAEALAVMGGLPVSDTLTRISLLVPSPLGDT